MFSPEPYRELFPVTKSRIYVNHAATSPYSLNVKKALDDFIDYRTFGTIDEWTIMETKFLAVHEQLAKILHTSADRITLTQNTTTGLALAATGIDWHAGDHVLLVNREFPANIQPFLKLRERGVIADFIEPVHGRITPDMIEQSITSRTRMFSISWVQFLNGFKADLVRIGQICRKHQLIFVVDTIQGLGPFALNAPESGAHIISGGGQKWLMGPQGIGFLWIDKAFQEQFNPPIQGWLGTREPTNLFVYDQPKSDTADRYLLGTRSSFGVWGLEASIKLLNEVLALGASEHIITITDLLTELLSSLGLILQTPRGDGISSGIVTISHADPETTQNLFEYLLKHHIHCSSREGLIRFSPHFYNTEDEMVKIAETCDQFLLQVK